VFTSRSVRNIILPFCNLPYLKLISLVVFNTTYLKIGVSYICMSYEVTQNRTLFFFFEIRNRTLYMIMAHLVMQNHPQNDELDCISLRLHKMVTVS
jgi:hypothetical protein